MSVDINSDYIKISEELFEVKILPEGTCDIHTNVNDTAAAAAAAAAATAPLPR